MVKSRKQKQSESKALSISHPNSRKALKLAKQAIKEKARNKSKLSHTIKRNIFGEKLLWFQQNLRPDVLVYTPQLFAELIQRYISRNDEELEQIQLKHSIGQRKNRQHASREDVIRITKERELEEFNGSGIEMVDILLPKNLEAFRKWEGNFGRLALLKISRFSKTSLEKYKPPAASKDLMEKQERLQNEGAVDDDTKPIDDKMDDDDDADDDVNSVDSDNEDCMDQMRQEGIIA